MVKSKPRKLPLEVIRLCPQCTAKYGGNGGALLPIEETPEIMRARKYRVRDKLFAVLTKPRRYSQHKRAHKLGRLIQENVEGFQYLDAHQVLKRLQIEGHIGCDYISVLMPGIGPVSYAVPKSLAYESMDEGEFQIVFKMFCEYVATQYWPDLDADQIAEMADVMEDD